jgi:hypothetical protein
MAALMKRADGSEALVTLAVPLPIDVTVALIDAIKTAAEGEGYTNISILTDGSNTITGRKPVPSPGLDEKGQTS